jgi:hypothetical protein
VGIVGVAGTIAAAKIAGNTAMRTARLSVGAEDRRARLADKRRAYARAIATLDAAILAAAAEASSRDSSGKPSATAESASWEAKMTAAAPVSEVELIAPKPTADLTSSVLGDVQAFAQGELDAERIVEVRQSLVDALRADLDEEARRSH